MKKENIGIFIFDDVEILDFTGPYEVFSSFRLSKKKYSKLRGLPNPFNIFTIAEKKNIITTGGLKIKSDYTLNNFPSPNILIIPGGIGTRKVIKNTSIIKWIFAHRNIDTLASVCTGSLLLAKAKLLENKMATTHWGAYSLLKDISPKTKIVKNLRYVHDVYFTSAGVSSGIDMCFAILELRFGKEIVKNTAKYIEYKY